jgi:serine/threonine protein kinase
VTDDSRFWVGPTSAPDTYQLVSCLGGGAEGEVWNAVLPLSAEGRRNVAVKILPPGDGGDDEASWVNHGHLLRSISHPGLVRVLEVFTGAPKHRAGTVPAGSVRYVVMDLIEGLTLREWLDENPQATVSQRMRTLVTVAAALDEMHSGTQTAVPVAHGDVKPSNIVIRADGSTVLVDLGLTRLTDGAGRVGRSRPYAAPELFQTAARSTPEADRFAFAATVVHAILGEPPPVVEERGPDVAAIEAKLQTNPASARRPILIRQLMEALSAPPRHRPSNLRSWLASLTDTLSQVTETGGGLGVWPAGGVGATATSGFQAAPAPAPAHQPSPAAPAISLPKMSQRQMVVAAVIAGVVLLGCGGTVAYRLTSGDSNGTNTTATQGPGNNTNTVPTNPAVNTTTSPTATSSPSTSASPDPSGSASSRPTGPSGQEIHYLQDLQSVSSNRFDSGTQKVDATTYPHSLHLRRCQNYPPYSSEYDLSRSYANFRAVIGVNDESTAGLVLQFEVFADDKRIGQVNRLSLGQHLEIKENIAGTLRLKLVISYVSGTGCATGVWGDAWLER